MPARLNLLINLPPTFFTNLQIKPYFDKLEQIANIRRTSHNTQAEIAADLPWAEAVFMWAWPNLDEGMLSLAPNLQFVGQINTTQTTVKACLKKGIAISETRHCWSPAVAELALGLMLAGLRKFPEHQRKMRLGQESWVNAFPAEIDPLERQLTGRPVGIVGFGGIGQRLAELLQPFHVTLRIYDPFLPAEVAARYGAAPVSLSELISESDVVVLCAANQPDAKSLVGKDEIALLRKNAVLVNVGRSMLLNMPALQERLAQGDLIALIDVFDKEPLEPDSPLRTLPNTFLTPHRAGGIMELVERALKMLTEDLEAHLAGQPRRYAVTEQMLISLPG